MAVNRVVLQHMSINMMDEDAIEEFIKELEAVKSIEFTKELYEDETHNSLFLDSFYKGIVITNK